MGTQTFESKTNIENNLEKLSDSELYQKCKKYGLQARLWRRKFAGLLPEVAKRELHKRRGYSSIYEFAGKIAGMTHDQTRRILQIASKLDNKPHLKDLLISGKQGWAKIETVSYVATPETDEKWAKKVEEMPKQALQVFVQEYKEREKNRSQSPAGGTSDKFSNNIFDEITSEGYKQYNEEKWPTLSFAVSPKVEYKLRLLKQTIEKESGEVMTWNEFLETVVTTYNPQLKTGAKKKRSIAHLNTELLNSRKSNNQENSKDDQKSSKDAKNEDKKKIGNRNIPIHIRREVLKKHNGLCAYPKCNKPPTSFHHTERYSLNSIHNENTIVPICDKHELLAHTGEVLDEEKYPDSWSSGSLENKEKLEKTDKGSSKLSIDNKVHMYRKE